MNKPQNFIELEIGLSYFTKLFPFLINLKKANNIETWKGHLLHDRR
jgi:hypothetical protein